MTILTAFERDALDKAFREHVERGTPDIFTDFANAARANTSTHDGEGLTVDKLLKMVDALPPSPWLTETVNLGFRERPGRLAGMDVFVEPPAPRRVEVRDIKLKDGTSILPAAFRERINASLEATFGRREPLCTPGMAYILSGQMLVMSSSDAARMRSIINMSAT